MIFTSALFFYAVVSLLINIGGITLCTGSIGCGPVKYFFTMVLPLSKTVVATVSVFTFLNVWNDYLWPSLVFTSSDLLTAQIGLNSITSNENTTMGQTLAVITLVTIPVIIIYSLFSRQIVEGVTSTGSKEG